MTVFEQSHTWDELIQHFVDSYVMETDKKAVSASYDRDYIAERLKGLETELSLECRITLNGEERWVRNVIIRGEIEDSEEDVKVNYIFAAPNTAAAYFALFQKLNNYLIFDPLNNKDDVKCFAAVATSLNNAFPHAVRSKNLYNIVIKGMKNTRQPQTKALEIPQDKIVETGIIDIALRDVKGNVRKLTDLKGKVVLLDFSVFQSPAGAPHNLMLRELYNEYAKQGLEIYQVSLDADEHYWKTAADNLPWVCVRDGNGVYSTNVAVYNVRQVPSIFLINRNNELKLRGEDIKDLEAAVKSLL